MRIVAVDWSGAMVRPERRIWRADADDDGLAYLRNGCTADEIASQLIDLAGRETLAVGLDFAFSLPSWFLEREGIASAPELWAMAAAGGCERWLEACEPPFWGRPSSRKPADVEVYRRTEREVAARTGFLPKSAFQIGGAGAVGTASLRGMHILHRLRAEGFHVWPYDDPGSPLLVEIYPRVFTGPVRKSDPAARRALIDARYPALPERARQAMIASDDAFDAGVSALAIRGAQRDLATLQPARDEIERIEGAVWLPKSSGFAPEAPAAQRFTGMGVRTGNSAEGAAP